MTDSINARLAKAISEVGALVKDTDGYNYSYADLNQVLQTVKPALANHGLVLSQPIDVRNGVMVLVTVITDSGSDSVWVDASVMLLPQDVGPQEMGSAITYYRRYALVSLFALEQYDDDGQAAQASATVDQHLVQLRDIMSGLDDDQQKHLREHLHDGYGSWGTLSYQEKGRVLEAAQAWVVRDRFGEAEDA